MAIEITDLTITEDYSPAEILRVSFLNDAMTSIETYANTKLKLNLIQLATDLLGDAYVFNDDGVQTRVNPLFEDMATLSENETIAGSWTFDGTVAFNEPATFNDRATAADQDRCKVYLTSANQSVPDSTLTQILFNAESFDNQAMHDTSTNSSRITIASGGGGVYMIQGQVSFAASATGIREAFLYKNGSVFAASTKEFAPSASVETVLTFSVIDTPSQSDYYEIFVKHTAGAANDVLLGAAVTFFSAVKMW